MTSELRCVPLVDGPVEIRGALALERTAAGILPRRLPAWTTRQYPDPFADGVTVMPSGVRLVFRTTATVVELDLLSTVHRPPGEPPVPGVVDVVVDGVLTGSAPVPVGNVLRFGDARHGGELESGEPGTVRFDGLPGGPRAREIELWLPQRTPCELVALRADAPLCPPGATGRRRWTHHGSSISHCMEADRPTGTWPVVAARACGVEVTNLGLAGNAMLDPYVARAIRDLPADLISLKLGINIVSGAAFRLRSFVPAVHGFLDTVREGHPDTPLLVVSPVSCPAVEECPGPTGVDGSGALVALGDPDDVAEGALTLRVIRDELSRLVAERAADDRDLHYLDGRVLLGPADTAGLVDGLHPCAAAYRRMGERFATAVFGPGGAFHRPPA